jgi:hypothetical protein
LLDDILVGKGQKVKKWNEDENILRTEGFRRRILKKGGNNELLDVQ